MTRPNDSRNGDEGTKQKAKEVAKKRRPGVGNPRGEDFLCLASAHVVAPRADDHRIRSRQRGEDSNCGPDCEGSRGGVNTGKCSNKTPTRTADARGTGTAIPRRPGNRRDDGLREALGKENSSGGC